MTNGVANDLQFAQAFRELEPYLLRGVKKTTDCKRLGTGSYGSVHELYVQGTLCAAKQLHESLLDPQDVHQGDKIINRFVEECRIMDSVRHPNIVQFLGLHFFQSSSHPLLVMEKLAMSLDDLLVESEKKKEMLPLSLKISILSDTAKGLAYLHNHKPQIIHRDLTSRNVLLTLAMQAKITDLGNALIIKSYAAAKAMTQALGTAVYMPPEAMQPQPKYGFAIDMFSYGHLALYTVIQEFPGDLLPPTFTVNGDPRNILARSEVERREKYMNSLHLMLGKDHQLSQIVTKCLSYAPSDRPCALDVLEELEKASKLLSDDIYQVFEKSSKLDLITMVDGRGDKKDRKESPKSTSSTHSSFEAEEGAPEYLELINISLPPTTTSWATPAYSTTSSAAMLQRCEQIKTGMPGSLAVSKFKTSTIRRRGRGPVVKTKKESVFMIKNSDDSAGPSLIYFEVPDKPKILKLADIANVKGYSFLNPSNFSFEIYLKGKDTPLELTATSKDEHDSWVEAITQLTGQHSQKSQQFKSPSPAPSLRTPSQWEQHEAANLASPNHNAWQTSGDIPVQQNAAFEVSPLSQRKLPLVPFSVQPPVPPRDLADVIATPSPVDDGYSQIRDFLPTHRKRSSLCLKDVTQFYEKHNRSLHQSASDSNLLSPGTSSVAKTLTPPPDLAQNKKSAPREQFVSVVLSTKMTEKQRAYSMDSLDVFAPDDGCLLHDTNQFYPNRREKFSPCPEEERKSHAQPALTQSGGNLSMRSDVKKVSSVDSMDAATPDDGYCDIKDFSHEDKCFYPRRRRRSSFCLEEEQSLTQSRGKLSIRSDIMKASSVDAMDAATPDDGYCDIKDFVHEDKCFYPRRRRRSSFCLEEEQSLTQSGGKLSMRSDIMKASSVDAIDAATPDDGYCDIKDFLHKDKCFYPRRRRRSSFSLEEEQARVQQQPGLHPSASNVRLADLQPALTQSRGKLSIRSDVKKASSVGAIDAATPDDGYCDIKDFLHEDKCFYPRRRRRSSFSLEEEQSRIQRQPGLRPSASNASLADLSTGASTTVSVLKMLSHFDSSQIEHLIEMAKLTTGMKSPDDLDDPSSSISVNDDAKPPPHYLIQNRNKSLPAALVKPLSANEEFKRRPTQLSLSLNECKFREEMYLKQHGNPTAALNALNGEAGRKGAEEKREVGTAPTLAIESTQSIPNPKQQQIKRSPGGHLKSPESSNAMKFKLVKWLSEADGTSNTSLLVTEDYPSTYERRPEWTKATTATTPVLSLMPIGDHLRKKELFIERSALQDLEEIGEGQFGKVYRATLIQTRSDNITVAVKTISKYKSEHETSDFLHEMRVVMDLMHPNIVHIHGIVEQDSPWLILQYFPNGDLKNYLINNERSIEQLIKYMIDIAMGMHYINEHGLVHRDLAARNVMVDNRETCKVTGFGLLREIPKDDTIYQTTTEMPWPIRWMAPESLDNREFSPATDVWSFGVLLWEMYYPNQMPYAELNGVQVLSKVLSGHRLPIPPNYPSTVAGIMKACWQREPEKRPSFLLISQTLLTS